MTTSFSVNTQDLIYILKQIQIAEAHASGTPLLEAIMQAYGTTAANAAQMPVGLRTVDGTFNNLYTAAGATIGAADTLFPRLTDPRYMNDQDGDKLALGPPGSGAPTITNTNYATPGSVADADPRLISNLIVDMTAGNPAAVMAALAYHGITGAAATTARKDIVAAFNAVGTTATAAHTAALAEAAALARQTAETAERTNAAAANATAQATLGAYNAALALDVDAKTAAAQDAVAAMVTSLGAVGSAVNPADVAAVSAAVTAATTAATAALDAYEALRADANVAPADLTAALAVSDAAAQLRTDVQALQLALDSSTPNLDTSEFNAAAAANTVADANASAANANTTQLAASQVTAAANAATTANNLSLANAAVVQDTADRNAAVTASNNADAAVVSAQAAQAAAQAGVTSAQGAVDTATANNLPFAQTLTAYNTALARNLDLVTVSARDAVAALVTSLGADGSAVDAGDVTAAVAAVAAAQTASDAAAAAVTALTSGPNVVAADLSNAKAVADDALALLSALQGLRANLIAEAGPGGDGLLNTADFNSAAAANTSVGGITAAATALVPQLQASQVLAVAADAPTAQLLADAVANLGAANTANDLAVIAVTDALTFAADKQLEEAAAIAELAASVAMQTSAATADTAAQAILTAYNAALALDVEVASAAAKAEASNLVASLGAVGSVIDAVDTAAASDAVAAATAAATAASSAANLLLAALGEANADVIAAQEVAANAAALASSLASLQSALGSASPLLDPSEFAAAAAALVQANTAESLAIGAHTQLDGSQATASTAATATRSALATADAELEAATTAHNTAVAASNAADAAAGGATPALNALLDRHGIEHNQSGSLVIPNQSPDIGLSPGFNSWMTFFGQFFSHGLDLVTKGGNGTVYIPLAADDPIIAGADGVFGTTDDLPSHLRFMALTRSTPTLVDGVPQHKNTTTSWIDQNQTYTSHASHQVFLREYKRVDVDGAGPGGLKVVSTGHVLDGSAATGSTARSIANWADIKAQAKDMLGLILSDFDVHNVPLLATDQYGKFIPGANGFAQIVMPPDADHAANWLLEGTAEGLVIPATALRTGHAFLDDIAHHANPKLVDHDRNPATPKVQQTADLDIDANGNGIYDEGIDTLTDVNRDGVINTADFFAPDLNADGSLNEATYDDEMLNSHFATGDGRGNENIALTTVHSIFHSEHNRLVEANKATILASGDLAFLNEWLLIDVASIPTTDAGKAELVWDGERLFQAARFVNEMQYQHLVFEEFARRIQPMIDPFVFNNSPNIDPSILAEFAHTVYRFGHSMLTGTVDRLDNDLTTVGDDADQATLLAAFLNPQMYTASGATTEAINANLVRGLSRDVGNEIDEFLVQDVRSNLLGLPLDLAALNIARGRDTGIPSLNETRKQLYEAGALDLKPYVSWIEFAQGIKNPLSIINFIAAYGTHASITSATTTAEMRDAATLLVFGDGSNANGVTIRGETYSNADRLAFINGTGIYAGNRGGLDLVDLWIGGLAEKKNEFGGMLGQTFNYIFEYQMEQLQFGDRLYYLTRTQGMNLLDQLEQNTFSELVMRNTDLGDKYATHLSGALFITPDFVIELDRGIAQEDYNGADEGSDPIWENIEDQLLLGDKVVRDYTNSTVVDGSHDFGGYLRFLGGEHVVVGGTEGNDYIRTDIGDDTLWGDGGDDYLNGGMGADDVFGGEGDDIIEDPFGDDVLRGQGGNDVIATARGFDLLFGGEGQDVILLGQDASEAFGGEGADFILGGAGADFLLGNEGDDWIEGGSGFDGLAGDNSELFFNSAIIGHDVLFGQGDETDYDAESGDDIMGGGSSVFRFEGMFGFDWAIAKGDSGPVDYDASIPIFTTIPNDILRDRFDQVEGFSGGTFDDKLSGDDRGAQGAGGAATAAFADHVLSQEGVDRITGLNDWLGSVRTTLFAGFSGIPGSAPVSTFRDGNILMGGDGNDLLKGRGGFDLLDGDAYLNVRIKIVHNGVTYSAESLNSDTTVAGQYAGKVFNTNPDGSPDFASPAFSGRSLTSLLLDGTINPGSMSIVREILTDNTNVTGTGRNVDTAVFQGNFYEYQIEGSIDLNGDGDFDDINEFGAMRDLNNDGDFLDANEDTTARDVNGDGFISVRDRDTGVIGASRDGVAATVSRGILTDDTDFLKNIEQLQFADGIKVISGGNILANGTVTISDKTPTVGQVLTASLSGLSDGNGLALGPNNLPVGLTFEWQISPVGNGTSWETISTGTTYTVRTVDPGNVLRAVAVFRDGAGNPERITSLATESPTAPFTVAENSAPGTIVGGRIPFDIELDPQTINGVPPVDIDPATLHHEIDTSEAAGSANGRFTVVRVPGQVDFQGRPIYQLVVNPALNNTGPLDALDTRVLLNYEAEANTPANQSFQNPDNQYQVVINSYDVADPATRVLVAVRTFTVFLTDVTGEVADIAPVLDLTGPQTVTTDTNGQYRDNFTPSSFNNSDGTTPWAATPWVESGDGANTAATGQIQIDVGNSNQMRFVGGAGAEFDGATITRTVNLAGVTTATLSFTVNQNNIDAGETVTVLFAADGVNFSQTVQVITGASSSTGATTSVALTGPFTATSAIRFVATAINGANEDVRIDNVNIATVTTTTSVVPGAAGSNFATTYTENAAAIAIAQSPTITDADNTLLMGATVKLTNAQVGDVLAIAGALPAGITSSFGQAVAGEITLYLSGPATLAAFQTAISAVRFGNPADNTPVAGVRTINVTVNDGEKESNLATASVTVVAVNDPAVANAETIITNLALGTAFVIPEWALLANDTDPDSPLDVTAVTENSSGFRAVLGPSGVTVTDTDGTNNSFTYTSGAAPGSSTANVAVTTLGPSTNTYEDNFNGALFQPSLANNSTGTLSWTSTSWTETADDNNIRTGQIQIDAGLISTNQLRFVNGDGATITRAVNLAGIATATMSFTVDQNGLDAGETVRVEFDANGDGTFETLLSTINTASSTTGATTTVTLTGGTANSAIRFVASAINGAGEDVRIDDLSIGYTTLPTSVTGDNGANILVGDNAASTFNGAGGNDIIFAGGGDDTIIQVSTEGRDILDGGAGNDTYQLNGDSTAETFNIYTRTAWLGLGNLASSLAPNTEIVVTRNAVVIAELDNIEEIGINTLAVTANDGNGALNGGANTGDTINIFGNFNAPETSLSFSTITIDGGAGRDTVNITGLASDHRIVFNTNDATDAIVGAVRPQDVVGSARATTSAPASVVVPVQDAATFPADVRPGRRLDPDDLMRTRIEHLFDRLGLGEDDFSRFTGPQMRILERSWNSAEPSFVNTGDSQLQSAAATSKSAGAYVMEVQGGIADFVKPFEVPVMEVQTGYAGSAKSLELSKAGISGTAVYVMEPSGDEWQEPSSAASVSGKAAIDKITGGLEVNISKFDIEAPGKIVTPVSEVDLMADHIIQPWMLAAPPNGASLWLADASRSEPPRTFFTLEDAFDDLRADDVSTRPDGEDFGSTSWTDSDFSKTFDRSHLVDGDYA